MRKRVVNFACNAAVVGTSVVFVVVLIAWELRGDKALHTLATTPEIHLRGLGISQPQSRWEVYQIECRNMTVTPEIGTAIGAMPCLFGVSFEECAVEPGALENLVKLRWLDRVVFIDSPIDAGEVVDSLSGADSIRMLSFARVPMELEDGALSGLRELRGIEIVFIKHTDISEAVIRDLGAAKTLKFIDLGGCSLSDGVIAELARLDSLLKLRLTDTDLTDRQLAVLRSCRKLEEIDVSGTEITEEAADILAEFESLKMAYTTRTRLARLSAEQVLANGCVVYAREPKEEEAVVNVEQPDS